MIDKPFTVAELIEELRKFPDDLPVLVSGYDNGYENFYQPVVVNLGDYPENPWTEGRFQVEQRGGIRAVVFMREKRDD
jgi:hypothetical protein